MPDIDRRLRDSVHVLPLLGLPVCPSDMHRLYDQSSSLPNKLWRKDKSVELKVKEIVIQKYPESSSYTPVELSSCRNSKNPSSKRR
jgi:hypothetical protein